jgi:hypothetical protein
MAIKVVLCQGHDLDIDVLGYPHTRQCPHYQHKRWHNFARQTQKIWHQVRAEEQSWLTMAELRYVPTVIPLGTQKQIMPLS